jgi:hypothetical protein
MAQAPLFIASLREASITSLPGSNALGLRIARAARDANSRNTDDECLLERASRDNVATYQS